MPNTGAIFRVNSDGTFKIVSQLNVPVSFEIIGKTAYIFTLNGEVWKIGDLACNP